MSAPLPPPRPGLTYEQFCEAVKSAAFAGLESLKESINTMDGDLFEELMKMDDPSDFIKQFFPDPLKLLWALTRPGVYLEEFDLLPRLLEKHPEITGEMVKIFKVGIVFDHDGEFVTAWVAASVHKDHNDVVPIMTHVTNDLLREAGISEDKIGRITGKGHMGADIASVFNSHVQKSEDEIVAEFSSKMDSIFDTWEGGT